LYVKSISNVIFIYGLGGSYVITYGLDALHVTFETLRLVFVGSRL